MLGWLSENGYITETQYASAFDSKGNVSGRAAEDLRDILYEAIFKGANQNVKEMFEQIPAKAQRAILATSFRDFDSPQGQSMIGRIQESIIAFNQLMSESPEFANAKNYETARNAINAWLKQSIMDFYDGARTSHIGEFSNFALTLAAIYKGVRPTQKELQAHFNAMYDFVQGSTTATLFDEADTTQYSLAEAIEKVLGEKYNLITQENGNNGSNAVAVDTAQSEAGQSGSNGNASSGEQNTIGEQPTDNRAGTASSSRGNENRSGNTSSAQKENGTSAEGLTHDEAIDIISQMEDAAEVAPEIELTIENWDAEFGEDGKVTTPIGVVKMGENQYLKLGRKGRSGKLGMIKPTLVNPDLIIEDVESMTTDNAERKTSYVFVKTFIGADGGRFYYFTSITVNKDGNEVVVSNQEKNRNRILRLLMEGNVIWRTPKDATTSSTEKQGLDYEQPIDVETTTKGSGITPQKNTPSADKVSEENNPNQISEQENVENPQKNETSRQRSDNTANAETNRIARMRKAVEKFTADLGISVEIYDTPEDAIIAGWPRGTALISQGWYGTKSGRVCIVLANNNDIASAIKTIRHEYVAHKNLRDMLGEEMYDAFCDRVFIDVMFSDRNDRSDAIHYRRYAWASISRKERLTAVPESGGKDFEELTRQQQKAVYRSVLVRRIAADEYIAYMAENGSYNNRSAWDKIMQSVRDFLREIGINVKFTAKDIQTLLSHSESKLRDTSTEKHSGVPTKRQGEPLFGYAARVTRMQEAQRNRAVYHGSGAKFDRFDHSHMGEGESAQAYGWGTYVTEVEGIGRILHLLWVLIKLQANSLMI